MSAAGQGGVRGQAPASPWPAVGVSIHSSPRCRHTTPPRRLNSHTAQCEAPATGSLSHPPAADGEGAAPPFRCQEGPSLTRRRRTADGEGGPSSDTQRLHSGTTGGGPEKSAFPDLLPVLPHKGRGDAEPRVQSDILTARIEAESKSILRHARSLDPPVEISRCPSEREAHPAPVHQGRSARPSSSTCRSRRGRDEGSQRGREASHPLPTSTFRRALKGRRPSSAPRS